ncbi:MAG: murein biosynthesis integral membrane protein MurJ [Planctomycetes bacterium]|nr:murein biosynthesis integral membrane protein MurJ [Planctomycetota bacterium]
MQRRIGIAAGIWGVSILLSRLVGLVREAVIGRTLGGSAAADAYWTAFVLPDFLNYLLAGGALSIVFIPIFQRHFAAGEEARGWQAFSSISSFLVLVLSLATLALWVLLPSLAPIVAPGFDAAQLALLVKLSRILLPAQIFHVLGGLCSAALQARDRHAVPALAPLVYTLCIVAGGLALRSAEGFAWGVLAGSVLGPFLMPLVACRGIGLRWSPRLALRDPDLRLYLARSLPIMLGFSIVVVDDWILRREGTLLGPGAVSAITYAKNLMKVPMGIFGLAAGVAAYPTLARLVAQGKPEEMRRTLWSTTRVMLVLAFAAQALLTVIGTELAALVYGRGKLSPEELEAIGGALRLVSIGLCAWSAQSVIARGFYALGNTWLPALLGTIVALAAYPLYVFLRGELGLGGLALASSIAILVYVALLVWMLTRDFDRIATPETAGWGLFFMRALSALGLAIGAGRTLIGFLPQGFGLREILLRAGLCGGVSMLVFFLAARASGLEELRTILGFLRRRSRDRTTDN